MLWSDFVDAVNSHLSVDATRRGLEAFRDRYMRNAVLDLQRYIRSYREGNTTTYLLADVTAVGQAQLVKMPSGCKPKAVFIYSTAAGDDPLTMRYRLDFYPWKSKQDLISGKLDFWSWWGTLQWPVTPPPTPPANCNGWDWCRRQAYVYSVAPFGTNFLIYPPLDANKALLLVWDGYKMDFEDTDTIPFPEDAAECVAAYIKWKITLDVDKNIPLAREHRSFYNERRLSLYRDWQDTLSIEEDGEEYDGMVVPPPNNFSNFAAQDIPLLGTVTMIEGVTNTALAAVPTVGLNVPLTVMIIIGGINQIWTLIAGTLADDPSNGVVRPNDYSLANPKVWTQSTV